MSEFSPGPWRWDCIGDEFVLLSPGFTGAGREVVRCRAGRGDPGTPDARLIAAAPELLEALKDACDAVSDCKDWRALIARIEGR